MAVKIAIDALGIDVEGGARTSILRMIQIVTDLHKDWRFTVYLSKVEPSLDKSNINQVILPFRRGIISRLFMQLFLPLDVLFRKIDLIHFTKSQASLVLGAKMVFTVHDLTVLYHPEMHSKVAVFYWQKIQPWMCRKMDMVFTVSEDAAKDIKEIYHVMEDKVRIIYNTPQFDSDRQIIEDTWKRVKNDYRLANDYFLYVGILALKKNLETLIYAYKLAKRQSPDLPPLYLVGPRYSGSDAGYVLELIEGLGLEDSLRYFGRIPKDDLFYIFKRASVFVFPAIHEGFGIPCLESMQLGVPLIASRASAIPEIVADAGVLVDDFMSSEKWAEALINLYHDPEMRRDLVKKGEERFDLISKKYSYDIVVEVYEDLLDLPLER